MLQTFRGGTVPSHSMHLSDPLRLALLGPLGPPAECAWAGAPMGRFQEMDLTREMRMSWGHQDKYCYHLVMTSRLLWKIYHCS